MKNIATAITAIRCELVAAGGDSPAFIEVLDNGSEIILGGNQSGLLQIALHAMSLAAEGVQGSHFHLDEHSGVSIADRPLVLRRSADEA